MPKMYTREEVLKYCREAIRIDREYDTPLQPSSLYVLSIIEDQLDSTEDPAVQAATKLDKSALLAAAKAGQELGTCDED